MPYIVKGNTHGLREAFKPKGKLDYTYDLGMDLSPGSELHNNLRDNILLRATESRTHISSRFDNWNEIDKLMTAYVSLTEEEKKVKEKDYTKPVSIVFPYSYAALESLLTYLTTAFFQDPIFQYEGMGPEDTLGAMLLELVIKQHCRRNKVTLGLHTILRDSLTYGIGIGSPYWQVKYGRKPVKVSVTKEYVPDFAQDYLEWVDDVLYEGNALNTIDPYLWLPDPTVDVSNIQSAEYVGWVVKDNLMNLLEEESNNKGLFNVRYLHELENRRSSLSLDNSARSKLSTTTLSYVNSVDVIYMYINLIPKEWQLGDGEKPEKWLFGLAGDDIIIRAERTGHGHGMFPVAVASPEYDGYSPVPAGRIEMLYGLQGVLDHLFNSHITNVRKSINDMFVVDPYLVNMEDMANPKPGKLIRLRKPAWGKGVDKVVQQLQVNDITRNNIADSAYITQWMDRISGADQSMSGALRQSGPERLTGQEFQGTRGSAMSRLQRLANIVGVQLMQDLGLMFASHTQQFMSQSTYVNLIGQNPERLGNLLGTGHKMVTPLDICVNYDILVRGGELPNSSLTEMYSHLFQIIAQSEELVQQFDVPKVFSFIAMTAGAKNIEDFRRQAQQTQVATAPDEEVMRGVEKGNMVPVEDYYGA